MDEFRVNIEKIISLSKKTTNRILFLGINQVDETKTSQLDYKPGEYYENSDLKEYNQCIANICKKNNINFVSMRDVLDPSQFEDGLHPD
jgi:lysophospholipase L1-like esterase